MTKPVATIARGIGEVLFLALLTLVAPLFVAIDVVVFGNAVGEISLTEIAQETLLLTSALIFWHSAWRCVESRGLLILVAGFFGCMLVRELDFLFNNVWHGFWVWPAIFVATASIMYARMCCRGTVCGPMSAFIDTKPYFHIVFGLLVVLVFSRVFGSGNLLWKHLVSDYSHVYQDALQEGLELFGYVFIAYGSCLFFWRKKTTP